MKKAAKRRSGRAARPFEAIKPEHGWTRVNLTVEDGHQGVRFRDLDTFIDAERDFILHSALRDLLAFHRRMTSGSDQGWNSADIRRMREIEELAGGAK